MNLQAFKEALNGLEKLEFLLPNGQQVPPHFHITEVGQIDKIYIDCGGKVRREQKIAFQLWTSVDTWHELGAEKLKSIIALSEQQLAIGNFEIEVEYQGEESIQKFRVDFNGKQFLLKGTTTACLAEDACGVSPEKIKVKMSELQMAKPNTCTPGGGCC